MTTTNLQNHLKKVHNAVHSKIADMKTRSGEDAQVQSQKTERKII